MARDELIVGIGADTSDFERGIQEAARQVQHIYSLSVVSAG